MRGKATETLVNFFIYANNMQMIITEGVKSFPEGVLKIEVL